MTEEFIGRPERRTQIAAASAAVKLRPYRTLALALATIAGLGAVFYVGRASTGDLLLVRPVSSGLPLPQDGGFLNVVPPLAVAPPSAEPSPPQALTGAGPILLVSTHGLTLAGTQSFDVIAIDLGTTFEVEDDPAQTGPQHPAVELGPIVGQPAQLSDSQEWGSGVTVTSLQGVAEGATPSVALWRLRRGFVVEGGHPVAATGETREGMVDPGGGTAAVFVTDPTDESKSVLWAVPLDGAAQTKIGSYYRGGVKGVDAGLHPIVWGADGRRYFVPLCYCDGVQVPDTYFSIDGKGNLQRASWLGSPGDGWGASRDGRTLAIIDHNCFQCTNPNAGLLSVADMIRHTTHVVVKSIPSDASDPVVSPSGRYLAYASNTTRFVSILDLAKARSSDGINVTADTIQPLAWIDDQRLLVMTTSSVPGLQSQTTSILLLSRATDPNQGWQVDNAYHTTSDLSFLGWIR